MTITTRLGIALHLKYKNPRYSVRRVGRQVGSVKILQTSTEPLASQEIFEIDGQVPRYTTQYFKEKMRARNQVEIVAKYTCSVECRT